jgi:hypothetical protein
MEHTNNTEVNTTVADYKNESTLIPDTDSVVSKAVDINKNRN